MTTNIVGWIRTVVDENFHSLPNSWQYAIVAAISACGPVVVQVLTSLQDGKPFNFHSLMWQCFVAVLIAHGAQRLTPPMNPPPPIENQSQAPTVPASTRE